MTPCTPTTPPRLARKLPSQNAAIGFASIVMGSAIASHKAFSSADTAVVALPGVCNPVSLAKLIAGDAEKAAILESRQTVREYQKGMITAFLQMKRTHYADYRADHCLRHRARCTVACRKPATWSVS